MGNNWLDKVKGWLSKGKVWGQSLDSFGKLEAIAIVLAFVLIASLLVLFAGCGQKSPEARVKEQTESKVHALTAEERQLAETNAKQFFNRDYPQKQADGSVLAVRGMFLDCRPSDSNYNGLVTCHGVLPTIGGGYNDKATRYCGYTPKLVGCSDEDTVK